jgi:acetylornithine deacetylase/succinyl-diaminopimelate desuccinylase-like protein
MRKNMIKKVNKSTLVNTLLGLLLLATHTASYADNDDKQVALFDNPIIAEKHTHLISSLLNKPKINTALSTLKAANEQNLRDLITLTQIPAPPFHEQERATYFAEMLRATGIADVKIDEVGNVIALRKGTIGKQTVAIVAHMDTVFPGDTDVTVKVQGDRFSAPGIGDNSRGMVAMLSVLRAMQSNNIQTRDNVLFVGSVGEEGQGDLRGVKHLLRDGALKIDAFIAIDGGDTNRLVYSAVGSNRYRVTFRGPGGHSWSAFGSPNPHHALARAIENFAVAAPSVTNFGDKTSYSVGRIGGGTSVNSIPFESWLEVDMRSGDQNKLDEIDAVFKIAVKTALMEENAAKKRGDDLTVEIEQIGLRPAKKGDITSTLVQNAMAAITAIGHTPLLAASSSDANIPMSKGIQAITLSRGGISGGSHSLQEWWENTDSHEALQIALLTLLSQAGYVE